MHCPGEITASSQAGYLRLFFAALIRARPPGNELRKALDDASRAFKKLYGTIIEIQFDPNGLASVGAAIGSMEIAINPTVGASRKSLHGLPAG